MISSTAAQVPLPEIVISPPHGGPDQPAPTGKGGGDAGQSSKDGVNRSLERLNKQLKGQVDKINPSENNPPIDARASDLKTGVANMPAVQQQYGKNFGKSVIPYRPAAPVYSSPLGRR